METESNAQLRMAVSEVPSIMRQVSQPTSVTLSQNEEQHINEF